MSILDSKLINLEKAEVQLNFAVALTNATLPNQISQHFTPFFEGVFDEGMILNDLDGILFQARNRARGYKSNKDKKGEELIWLTL